MSETELSLSRHEQAVKLHNRIMASANLAQQSLWEMCTGLKEMRDGKLYKALGYANFEDYCETEVGLKRRQALKYVAIVENVDIKNVQSTAHLGTEKLYLLSTIDKEQQHEISEKVNLEETTVKQLKAEIDKLKTHNRDLGAAKDKAVAALTPLEDELRQLKSATDVLKTHLSEAESQTRTAKQELDTERARLNKTARDLQEAREANKELIKENNQLIDENEELRSRPVEVAVVDNSAENDRKLNEVIRSLERENMKRNEELEQQYREDEKAVRKMLEKDKQKALSELREEYEKKLAEQSKAEPVDEDKLKFKIYLTSTFDMLNRLTEFTSQHNDPIYKEKIKQLLNSVLAKMEE